MAIVDIAGNPLLPATTAQMLGFIEVSAEEALTLKAYNFLLKPIRDADQQEGNLFVKRFLDGPQTIWERTQSTIFALKDLWSITDIEDEHLQYLKNIVGWTEEQITKRVTDALSFDELRRLISISVPFWKARGPEDTIVNILSVLTGSRLRIWNWFDFRWILDETEMSEDHEGRDPWVVDLPVDGDDEHRFNVRIVDPVIPEALDQDLVANILKLTRPMGERIEVTFIDFLDQFLLADDDSQWDLAVGTALVIADGRLKLLDTGEIEEAVISDSIVLNSVNWTTGIMAYMRAKSSEVGIIGMKVLRADSLNFYEVRVSIGSFPTPATVLLRKTVAGVGADIVSVSLAQAIILDEWIGLRVSIEPESATNRIKVYVDGEEVIDTTDSDLTQGSVSVQHLIGADLEVSEVEVFETPLVTNTIDINTV